MASKKNVHPFLYKQILIVCRNVASGNAFCIFRIYAVIIYHVNLKYLLTLNNVTFYNLILYYVLSRLCKFYCSNSVTKINIFNAEYDKYSCNEFATMYKIANRNTKTPRLVLITSTIYF